MPRPRVVDPLQAQIRRAVAQQRGDPGRRRRQSIRQSIVVQVGDCDQMTAVAGQAVQRACSSRRRTLEGSVPIAEEHIDMAVRAFRDQVRASVQVHILDPQRVHPGDPGEPQEARRRAGTAVRKSTPGDPEKHLCRVRRCRVDHQIVDAVPVQVRDGHRTHAIRRLHDLHRRGHRPGVCIQKVQHDPRLHISRDHIERSGWVQPPSLQVMELVWQSGGSDETLRYLCGKSPVSPAWRNRQGRRVLAGGGGPGHGQPADIDVALSGQIADGDRVPGRDQRRRWSEITPAIIQQNMSRRSCRGCSLVEVDEIGIAIGVHVGRVDRRGPVPRRDHRWLREVLCGAGLRKREHATRKNENSGKAHPKITDQKHGGGPLC